MKYRKWKEIENYRRYLMCCHADRTVVMVTIIIVMMKGYYKNTGCKEKQH